MDVESLKKLTEEGEIIKQCMLIHYKYFGVTYSASINPRNY